jgi:pimeloyl-ACP methyl ester carboxylesterase
VAERILCTNAGINVVDLLPTVRVPTLVMHTRGDVRVPFSQGQEIAAGIPGAKFVPLESRNHIILAHEPANRQFFDAIASFLGDRRSRDLASLVSTGLDTLDAPMAPGQP